MLTHHTDFKEYEIWYLFDTKQFTDRKLLLGRCPQCHKDVARLDETRISDGEPLHRYIVGYDKVSKISNRLRSQIKTTKSEQTITKGLPVGICYGINKAIISRKKETYGQIIGFKQYRKDIYGQTELIKTVLQSH